MHLLVIEDERALCETIVRSLRRLAYSVDYCHDGEKALALLGVERYDLVLLDLNLPKKDGMPVPDGAMAWITCRVVKLMDAGTHTIFLGEVTDCDLNREDGIPMTYQFYHSVIKGASPKNAPTYISPED